MEQSLAAEIGQPARAPRDHMTQSAHKFGLLERRQRSGHVQAKLTFCRDRP
jgi:hypothetical protein